MDNENRVKVRKLDYILSFIIIFAFFTANLLEVTWGSVVTIGGYHWDDHEFSFSPVCG